MGVGEGVKKKKTDNWSNLTVSDRCCRAECQLSGGLCVLSQVPRGGPLPACRLALHLFPSSNVNVNLLLVTSNRSARHRGEAEFAQQTTQLRFLRLFRRTPRVLATGSNQERASSLCFFADDKIKTRSRPKARLSASQSRPSAGTEDRVETTRQFKGRH